MNEYKPIPPKAFVLSDSKLAKVTFGYYGTNASITIITESGIDDGAYYPAESMSFSGLPAIKELRDLCDSVLNDCALMLDATKNQPK